MVIPINTQMWDAMRAVAKGEGDAELAAFFRAHNTAEVAHYSDAGLVMAIKDARVMAQDLGITGLHLRVRFIMLGVIRLPRFWERDALGRMLTLPTGTPNIRFEDVCMAIKRAAERADGPNAAWWV